MKVLDLFSGIGGFSVAASQMGWETIGFCEYDEFCQRVLRYYWPNAEIFGDITKTDFKKYANQVDIVTGGFPCQAFSTAGKRKGDKDERYLWPEMFRAIREVKPRYVVAENVSGLLNWNKGMVFKQVCTDLESEGYEVQAFVLPACGINAPHRRDRVWFIAYSSSNGQQRGGHRESGCKESEIEGEEDKWERIRSNSRGVGSERPFTDTTSNGSGEGFGRRFSKLIDEDAETRGVINTNTSSEGFQRGLQGAEQTRLGQLGDFHLQGYEEFPTQSPICGGDDGLPKKLSGITFSRWRNQSIKALGNSIVPGVVLQIFKAIDKYEQEHGIK
jgi:DNA (cytosine-5)-methyltransferase 1